MGAVGFIVSLVLFGLNLFGTLRLERLLQGHFEVELALIVVLGLLSLVTMIGILLERRWAWSAFTMLFGASLANLIFLFISVGASVTIAATILVSVLGLVLGLLAIDADADVPPAPLPLETYTPPQPLPAVEPVYDTLPSAEAPSVGSASMKKPRRKKAAKKSRK